MKACCKGTTAKQQKQHQMQPTGQLPLRSKQLDNSGQLTSNSPSQSVSALPRGGSVEGEVQCWCHPVLGQETPHEGMLCVNNRKGAEATPDAADRKAATPKKAA